MKGATSSTGGESGLVPAPAAGQQSLFLRGDGTWAAPEGKNYSNATTSTSGLMSAADKTKLDGINLSNYALNSHTHDDRYYTENEINTKLNAKANSSHTHSYNDLTNKPTIPTVLDMYPVGSVYFTTDSNFKPATKFGGTWTQIGSKLAVSENVFGNGKALGLTNGSTYVGVGGWTTGSLEAGTNAYGKGVGNSYNSVNLGGKTYGVPTKTQLNGDWSKSGLIVDTVTIYSWKRTG